MEKGPKIVSMKVQRSAARVIALAALAGCVSPVSAAFAQGRMLVLSTATVQQGQTVHVTSPACTATTTVLVDGRVFPAAGNGSNFDVATTSLAPGIHAITIDCGGTTSDPAPLTVVEVKPAGIPAVVCARNASPRDGTAAALTSAAEADERRKVDDVKRTAAAQKLSYPTSEEDLRLLSRCDGEWVWTFRLEDSLSLNVVGLTAWQQDETNRRIPLHLFIGGVELPNIVFSNGPTDPATKTENQLTVLTFAIDTGTPEERAVSRKAWAQVLRTARANAWNYGANEMSVSIGPAGGPPWPTTAKLRINPYPTGLSIAALGAVLALAILLIGLAWKTPLLRDRGGKTAPFSLAKHQMAVWFFVIFSAFLFVTVTTGQAAAMSATALMLIGISGATGLAAVAIDSRKRATGSGDARALEAERQPGTQELAGGVTKTLAGPTEGQEATSRGWVSDVLSDEYGLSFHRLQMAAWTVALAVVFIVAVWRTFAMPEFDATMLGLLGLSSGTYLGFKLPERDTTSGSPTVRLDRSV